MVSIVKQPEKFTSYTCYMNEKRSRANRNDLGGSGLWFIHFYFF